MTELEVLDLVSKRLAALKLDFMLTGSFAMAYYATPRMTRDLDLVVALTITGAERLVHAFEADFYVDLDAALDAVRSARLFNLMHLKSGVKVDIIVQKAGEYRQVEFARRQRVDFGGIATSIVSREDLILSKLVWARDAGSDLQLRDVRALIAPGMDIAYLHRWAESLGELDSLSKVLRDTLT